MSQSVCALIQLAITQLRIVQCDGNRIGCGLNLLFDEQSILWFRGYVSEDSFATALDQTLEGYGARLHVVGHTPVPSLESRYDGKLLAVDLADPATEMLLLGDKVDAGTAERFGLANKVVPDGEVKDQAMDWARRLADGPTLAISMTKRMIQNELHMDIVSAVEAEAQAQALLLQGKDHRAFYEAFKEKRAPRFTGE